MMPNIPEQRADAVFDQDKVSAVLNKLNHFKPKTFEFISSRRAAYDKIRLAIMRDPQFSGFFSVEENKFELIEGNAADSQVLVLLINLIRQILEDHDLDRSFFTDEECPLLEALKLAEEAARAAAEAAKADKAKILALEKAAEADKARIAALEEADKKNKAAISQLDQDLRDKTAALNRAEEKHDAEINALKLTAETEKNTLKTSLDEQTKAKENLAVENNMLKTAQHVTTASLSESIEQRKAMEEQLRIVNEGFLRLQTEDTKNKDTIGQQEKTLRENAGQRIQDDLKISELKEERDTACKLLAEEKSRIAALSSELKESKAKNAEQEKELLVLKTQHRELQATIESKEKASETELKTFFEVSGAHQKTIEKQARKIETLKTRTADLEEEVGILRSFIRKVVDTLNTTRRYVSGFALNIIDSLINSAPKEHPDNDAVRMFGRKNPAARSAESVSTESTTTPTPARDSGK